MQLTTIGEQILVNRLTEQPEMTLLTKDNESFILFLRPSNETQNRPHYCLNAQKHNGVSRIGWNV